MLYQLVLKRGFYQLHKVEGVTEAEVVAKADRMLETALDIETSPERRSELVVDVRDQATEKTQFSRKPDTRYLTELTEQEVMRQRLDRAQFTESVFHSPHVAEIVCPRVPRVSFSEQLFKKVVVANVRYSFWDSKVLTESKERRSDDCFVLALAALASKAHLNNGKVKKSDYDTSEALLVEKGCLSQAFGSMVGGVNIAKWHEVVGKDEILGIFRRSFSMKRTGCPR